MEFEVFYDKNEEHRILAENVEDYLGPIYRSEAAFVVCFLGRVDNSWVNLRRLGNQLGGILEPFVLVIILS